MILTFIKSLLLCQNNDKSELNMRMLCI